MAVGLSTFSPRLMSYILIVGIFCLIVLTTPLGPPIAQARVKDPQHGLSYRAQLARLLPKDFLLHSRTLLPLQSPTDTAAIYVVSLARRQDRRKTMAEVANALDLNFTFVDATDFNDAAPGGGAEIVDTIMQRVGWQRWFRIDERDVDERETLPKGYDQDSSPEFVYHAFPFEWSQEVKDTEGQEEENEVPRMYAGADFWDVSVPGSAEWAAEHPMQPLPISGPLWRTQVNSAGLLNHVRKSEPLRKAAIACWHSHVVALRDMVQKGHAAALILEDDIDIEFDIEKILAPQWSHLPADWDIVYLGHCHSQEYRNNPLQSAPRFRVTHHILCTHGYAVSRKGARKILKLLRSADYAYSKPIDHGLKDLVQQHLLKSYSAYPPLVVQRKEDISDIIGNATFNWSWNDVEGELVDSSVARIRAHEQKQKVRPPMNL